MIIIQRTIEKEIAPSIDKPEAVIITGMRRTGKTTILRKLYDNSPNANKIFLDLEDIETRRQFSESNYDGILRGFERYGVDSSRPMTVFLDEIQNAPNLPSIAKYLIDNHGVKFFMTGSASFYLRRMFSESMAGRKRIFELFPFSFDEFLLYKQSAGDRVAAPRKHDATELSPSEHTFYARYFEEYLRFGGFPAVVAAQTHADKEDALREIFSSYFQLEVERLSDFRKKDKVRDLLFLLMERTGSLIDTSTLSRTLGVARETIADYLVFLEDTYFIRTISAFSTNRAIEIRKAKKLYLCDTGILTTFSKVADGPLFENACFNLLRSRSHEIHYWREKTGAEIDFITDRTHAYEVKVSAQTNDVRTLSRRAKKIGIGEYSIVSKSFASQPHITYGFLL